MSMFSVPEGYSCVTRQSDTTLYAYKGNQRDTYIINGIEWEHTSTQTNSTIPANSVCHSNVQIPSSVVMPILLVAAAFALGFLSLVYKIMKRSFL